MSKLVLVFALLLVSLNAFSIYETVLAYRPVKPKVKEVNWPFQICGDGTWTPEKLSMTFAPARNTNDTITVVSFYL